MSLNEDQEREVERIAKLEVRQYFDYYMQEVLPIREKAQRAHTHVMIERHNDNREAHGGVEATVGKSAYWLAGASAVIGASAGFLGPALLAMVRGH